MTDEQIWDAYMQGFSDENDIYSGRKEPLSYKEPILQKAYNTGRTDFMIGDDVMSHDYRSRENIIKDLKK